MELTTTTFVPYDIYGHTEDMALTNKLFCTFVEEQQIDGFIEDIKNYYTIAYNKIFVLYVKSNNEYVCTYNIMETEIDEIPYNTILVHRKKESNTLYTINALNALIRQLNNGVLDTRFIVNWADYKNCILLNTGPELRRLDTAIYKIIDFNK